MDDGKAAHPPEVEPKTLAASHGWPLTRKVLKVVVGVLLLLLGLAALFTPFTPGSWLALVGLEFLGLRVLLRDWLCARARAKPESRLRKAACQVFSLGRRDMTKRRWWQRRR
jgi:protein-S-isoprenylcysteine O-methyltransferase Ste14